jgi:hypothetical protein
MFGFQVLELFDKEDKFLFIVNGNKFEMSLATAIALSPAVRQQMETDACSRQFVIYDPEIQAATLEELKECFKGSIPNFELLDRISLLSISRKVDNIELMRLLFSLDASQENTDTASELLFERKAVHFDLHSLAEMPLLSVDALDLILLNDFFRIESEDVLLTTLLDLGPEYQLLLRHVHWNYLSPESYSECRDLLLNCDLTESFWTGIGYWALCGIGSHRISSLIVTNLPPFFSRFRGKEWNLLYRGSRDGFHAKTFHERCDYHGNTVSIISDRFENIFGGFTPLPWESPRRGWFYKSDISQKSFLFTLHNPHGIAPTAFPLNEEHCQHAIYCSGAVGPVFGHGYDLFVGDDCANRASSHTGFFGDTYINTTSFAGSVLFTNSHSFIVKEIEVFEILE